MLKPEGILEISGVPVGRKGESRLPFVSLFENIGVPVDPVTVSRFRMGDTSGVRTADRLNCARVLEENSAERKNRFFLILATYGLRERQHNVRRDQARFNSWGYTERLAQALDERPQVVRRCIRAMRADLVCESLSSPDPDLVKLFCGVAEDYLTDFPHTALHLRPRVIQLVEQGWDHKTALSFYQKLYQCSGARNIGPWTPYEMEVLQQFYAWRFRQENVLTSLDKAVLSWQTQGRRVSGLVEGLIKQTGIPIDDEVIYNHRNLLVYGRPTPRMI